MREIPAGCRFWPTQHQSLSPASVVQMYNNGFAGCWTDREAEERIRDEIRAEGGNPNGGEIAHAMGWAGSGAGKLVVPFVHQERLFPGSMPGPAQERGDCVSHSTKNACVLSMVCEIVAGKPDEVTGKLEGPPDVPPLGVQNGVLSTEWLYWWRGYNGDGWHCPTALRVAQKHGLMVRQPYPELGIDLSDYSGRLAGKFGSKSPPEEMDAVGRLHCARQFTECRSFEEVRDFLHNGYAISSCGGEGWSNQRDENGFSRRSGRWAHAMAYVGADDRDETKQKYGEPLVLIQNSWGRWNSGGRRILGTGIDIPEGSFWAKWSDCRNRYAAAVSSVDGWPARELPPIDMGWG